MQYVARPHQVKAVYDIVTHLRTGSTKPVLAVLPTAAGKSWVIADLIQKMGDPATIVFQPTQELLKQNFKKYTGPELQGKASLYSASVGKKNIGHVTYATPGSVKNIADKFQHVKLVIIDEAHLGTTPRKMGKVTKQTMMAKFIKALPKGVQVIGLTATPLVLKNSSNDSGYFSQLKIITRVRPKFWSKIIHVTQVAELYKNGYLTPLRFTTYDFGMRKGKVKGSDFDLDDVAENNEKKNVIPFTIGLIKKAIKRGKKKILVFTPTVGEAYQLKKAIPHLEVVAADTKKKDRKRIIEEFVEGDLKVIANYGTLTTGFDAPEIDLIVCLRPTQSYAIWYQLIGRGIRIAEGKDLCDVVDLSGNYKVFGDPKDLIFEECGDVNGWGMFVNDYLISGIPIGQKIHKKYLDISKKRITFGKYKGMLFTEVPTSYLEWVAGNFDLSTGWARENVKKPLKRLGII